MTDIPTHLHPRVVALLMAMSHTPHPNDNYAEARAIVAELPEPPDPLLDEAREILAVALEKEGQFAGAQAVRSGGIGCDILLRSVVALDAIKIALAALRRGQEIGRGGE